MEGITSSLGNALRKFSCDTCAVFPTQELKREALSRYRRRTQAQSSATSTRISPTVARQPKTLNLSTYKLHALGDYTSSIRIFGSTDSYSTQLVSTRLQMYFFLITTYL